MGKRDRERIARIKTGLEKPISATVLKKAKETGVAYLQSQSTSKQVQFLADSLHSGNLSASRLRKELVKAAPKEMHDGAEKLRKKGETPTVALLLEEYRSDRAFQALACEVGLDEEYFMELAKTELGVQ